MDFTGKLAAVLAALIVPVMAFSATTSYELKSPDGKKKIRYIKLV